jgi:hypothetical protein
MQIRAGLQRAAGALPTEVEAFYREACEHRGEGIIAKDEMPLEQQLARGELKVTLHGRKLEGGLGIETPALDGSAVSDRTVAVIAAGRPAKKRKTRAA